MSLFFIALFSFLAAVGLFMTAVLLSYVVQMSPSARIRRRLEVVGRSGNTSNAHLQSLLKTYQLSRIPWLDRFLAGFGLRKLYLLIEQANVGMSVGALLLFSLVLAASASLALAYANQPKDLAVLGGLLVASLPYLYLKFLARRRLRRFLEQFPDALDVIARGLEAGLGVNQSVILIAKEMPDPVGTEFAILVEELNLGLPMEESMNNFCKRNPLPEVGLWNVAMLVQRDTGGSLAELLSRLADLIRDRFRVERQIKTLTAQNRISAWVVCSAPVFLMGFFYTMDPEGIRDSFADPLGYTMYTMALLSWLAGVFAFRMLLRIRV